jgi:prephenate dehydrogenase
LIGASIGLALRSRGWSTVGWDPNEVTLDMAESKGAVDPAADAGSCANGADVVFLAGPLHANVEMLRNLSSAALTTDVTSVKRPLLEVVPDGCRFIGGHPMAGREHAGPAAATPALFRGAPWVLCEDGAADSDLEMLTETILSIGANPVVMDAATHDEIVAGISHLPHLLAAALTGMADDHPEGSALVSGSFRDLTRVASSDAGWWPEVLAANADEVSDAIDRLVDRLKAIERLLEDGDVDGVRLVLEQARESRTAMAPRLSGVQVVLQDRPGELAAVGRAFSTSHVDVRDLQLRHAEHGGGGVLTITVRPGEAEPLRQALEQEGFTLE